MTTLSQPLPAISRSHEPSKTESEVFAALMRQRLEMLELEMMGLQDTLHQWRSGVTLLESRLEGHLRHLRLMLGRPVAIAGPPSFSHPNQDKENSNDVARV